MEGWQVSVCVDCLQYRGVWAVQCLGQCVCAAVVAVTMAMGHWTLPHTATHCHTLPHIAGNTRQDCPAPVSY